MADNNIPTDAKPENKKLSGERLRQAIHIFKFVQPYKWHLVAGLILLFFSSLVFMVIVPLTGEMVDIALGKSRFGLSLADIGWLLVAVLVGQGVVSYFRIWLFAIISEKGTADVRQALYARLIALPIVFFEKTRTGELVSRVTADVEKLYHTFSITIAEFLRQVLILLAGIIFLAVTTPRLALIMLATVPVIVVVAMFFGKMIRKLSKARQEELANSNIILSETMQTIHVVKAFTNEFFERMRYAKSIDKTVDVSLKYARGRSLFAVFIITVLFGALFFIIWEGAVMVSTGEITPGQLISFVVYTAAIGGAIAGLGSMYTEILGAVGATERIREILNEPAEVEVVEMQPRATARVAPTKLLGDIEFQDVHFDYPTRPDVPVLKGISFQIPAGQKVALVGPSGAGKSTIVQLVLKFYGIKSGDILADGKSIFDMDTTAYRQNIAIVPQEVLLFGGTIRENILYGKPDATDAEIIEAAKQANAWEYISRFPEGLETVVGDRGIKLSGGQRQRIAIARAILKNPAILLLDEATSSLDAESEKVVQEALDKLMEGRTSIIIAHRLATVRNVDCIYVIEHGRIVEQGTHEELSMMEDGVYTSLARLQFELA